MKIKSRGQFKSIKQGYFPYFNCSNGTKAGAHNVGAAAREGKLEVIKYTNTPLIPFKHRFFQSCDHVKSELRQYPLSGNFSGGSTLYNCPSKVSGDFMALSLKETDFNSARPSQAELDAFNARAYQAMYPSFESDVSATNFLYELRELTDLKTLVKSAQTSLSGRAAELHIGYSFGLRPLISDIKAIYDLICTLDDRVSNFLAYRNKIQKRHYSEHSDNEGSDVIVSFYSSARATYQKSKTSTKFTATMVYTYDCPEIKSLSDKLRVFRDMFGLHINPAVIWQGIPFSFAADWIARIGDFLEQFSTQLWRVELNIVDYCISYKSQSIIQRDFEGAASCTNMFGIPRTVTSQAIVTIYNRRVCLPNTNVSLAVLNGHYGPTQLALTASLLRLNVR